MYNLDCSIDKQRVLITEFNQRYKSYLEITREFDNDKMELGEFHYRILTNPEDSLARWTGHPEDYVSLEAIQESERWLTNLYTEFIPSMIAKGKRSKEWIQMLAESEYHKQPQHYKTDFTYHDAFRLGYKLPKKFIWILRDCGTWLLTDWYVNRFERAVIDQCLKSDYDHCHFYLCENGRLNPIEASQVYLI